MSIGHIDLELQQRCVVVGEHGHPAYEMINVSAHDGDPFILISKWVEVDGDEDKKIEFAEVVFHIDCLDRLIAYLNLVKQWQKDVSNFPIKD